MNEPYNDEEFEITKQYFHAAKYGKNPDTHVLKRVDRLIATIELQKSDKDLGAALVRKVQELKEDNRLLGKLAKSNVETTRVQLDKNSELIEENAKLKTQLEAALKRIEEME